MEHPVTVTCPWCGEAFTTFLDPTNAHAAYVEDCQICCRPLRIVGGIDPDGAAWADASRED